LGKLQKYLGGLKMMRRVPDIVVIVDTRREYNAIQECQKLSIPIVSLLDTNCIFTAARTNCDPDVVDMPIPANDDAIRSIKLIVSKLADAIYEGRHGEDNVDYGEFEEALDEGSDYEQEGDEEEDNSEWADAPSATDEENSEE